MKKKLTAIAGAVALALSLAACDSTPATSEPIGGNVITPLIVDYATLDGATLDIRVGQAISINVGDTDVTAFDGSVGDPAIAEWVPGRNDGSAEFNPGFRGKSVGETVATITPTTATPIIVTINVTE